MYKKIDSQLQKYVSSNYEAQIRTKRKKQSLQKDRVIHYLYEDLTNGVISGCDFVDKFWNLDFDQFMREKMRNVLSDCDIDNQEIIAAENDLGNIYLITHNPYKIK
jgi:hypothetical protein